jgi:hypothetical protein
MEWPTLGHFCSPGTFAKIPQILPPSPGTFRFPILSQTQTVCPPSPGLRCIQPPCLGVSVSFAKGESLEPQMFLALESGSELLPPPAFLPETNTSPGFVGEAIGDGGMLSQSTVACSTAVPVTLRQDRAVLSFLSRGLPSSRLPSPSQRTPGRFFYTRTKQKLTPP